LRIALTILVVLHHCCITYGAPGEWYFIDGTTSVSALLPMTLFVAVNQSFFMGFFFLLSGLFVDSSLRRRGPARFVLSRLTRLGVPLIFYSLVISPTLGWMLERFGKGQHISFGTYLGSYDHWLAFGVLWFVAALLLFDLIYVLVEMLPGRPVLGLTQRPDTRSILLFATSVALISWLVRAWFPIGWILRPLGFELAYFTQYTALFVVGIYVARGQWLRLVASASSTLWVTIALLMIFLGLPLMYLLTTITGSSPESFTGGGSYQSLVLASWEQFTGIPIIICLLIWAQAHWNRPSLALHRLSRSTYSVYIIHPLVLVPLALLFTGLPVAPANKFFIVAPLAVTISFIAGLLIVRAPGLKHVV
jgi:hypothetical protein